MEENERFHSHIIGAHAGSGEKWLRRIPQLLDQIAKLWQLDILQPFPELTYSYVVRTTRADGSGAVLKLSLGKEMITEIDALRHFDGSGMVRLLEADVDLGALLLEQLIPGIALDRAFPDDPGCEIPANLMRQYWQPPPEDHTFPTLHDWGRGFTRLRDRFMTGTGPFPPVLVDRAEKVYQELVTSQSSVVLLHGDLHHGNVLSAGRLPWLAIDPKGVVGEPAYEVGAWLRNPVEHLGLPPDPVGMYRRKVNCFAELLGFDPKRISRWGFAQGVLSAWWGYEDRDPAWVKMLEWAELISLA